MSEPLDLEPIRAREKLAFEELIRICKVGEQARMSIPANPARDTDLIITATFADVFLLLNEVTTLRTQLAAARRDAGALGELASQTPYTALQIAQWILPYVNAGISAGAMLSLIARPTEGPTS